MHTTLRAAIVALAAALVLPAIAHAHTGSGTSQTFKCGGSAPSTTGCSDGPLDHRFTAQLRVECWSTASFTGTITVQVISFPQLAREFTCVFRSGQLVATNGQGFWPNAGQLFNWYCDVAGVGGWECRLLHD